MGPPPRLPRALRLSWRDLDLPFVGWVALSLFAHGATAAAASRAPRVEPVAAVFVADVGFVALAQTQDPLADRFGPNRGVHEILGSPVGDGPRAGDLLALGALDADLTSVLAEVDGVRLPYPGERLTFRPRPQPPRIYDFGCGADDRGRVSCRCVPSLR